MRRLALVVALTAGLFAAAPVTGAQAAGFAVQNTCSSPPIVGTNTCFVAAPYTGDYDATYTNMDSSATQTNFYTQASGHPFVGVTGFTVANTKGVPSGDVSKVRVDLPKGLISNPQAVPQCTTPVTSCPSSSQVGVVQLEAYTLGTDEWFGASVYNMVPPKGDVSDFAFNIPLVNQRTDIIGGIRSGSQDLAPGTSADDGLYFTIAVPSTTPSAELVTSTLIFWGDPGDSAHSPDVGWSCDVLDVTNKEPDCGPPPSGTTSSPSGTPFLTLPSGCVPAGQVSTLTLTDSSGDVAQATEKTPVPATGCGKVPFDPSLTLTPQTTQADSPTGLTVDLHVPQDENGADLSTSMLQTAAVTLPPGMTLNPSAANGLQSCSAAQFAQGSDAAPTCPAGSQVGTVTIDTPLLPKPVAGSVYLGCNGGSAQTPCSPATPGGSVAPDLYVYATDASQGIVQKLVGTVTTNPSTGQVTTTFANQPQVPFSDFILNFNGGPTATVANPLQCGAATTASALTPYSGNAAATPTSSFTVGGGTCPASFAPGLSVKEATLQAGAFDSPFTVDVTRADGQQYLSQLKVALPPGLVGLLASVPQCSAPQASAGTCSAASQIGSTTVLAGAGSDPVSQTGTVYLTGPYNGAPFGLSIVVPAIAGPFDLGTVVVRAGIGIDINDAHVTITSDPLPQVVGGVPLRIRSVAVTIDRPDFMLNPTSCGPLAIDASLVSAQGANATAASPFQATGCASLPFAPTLTMALSGNRQTVAGGHPTLTATVTSRLGQANVRSAAVTLPLSLALDPNNSEHVCSVADSDTDSCPANTVIGSARVKTPLLSRPLTGNVYLVQGFRTNAQGQQVRTLPSLLIPLRGQVAIDLRGQTSVDAHSRLVTTFPTVPDAAISSFALTITGGRRGILVVTGNANLCRGREVALAAFGAQSGASSSFSRTITVPCAKRASVKRVSFRGQLVQVRIAVPARGNLVVGGPGLTTVRVRVARRRVVSSTLHLTKGATARLDKHHSLRVYVAVLYTPTGWPTQTLYSRKVTIR